MSEVRLSLVLFCALTLCGCAGENNTKPAAKEPAATEKPSSADSADSAAAAGSYDDSSATESRTITPDDDTGAPREASTPADDLVVSPPTAASVDPTPDSLDFSEPDAESELGDVTDPSTVEEFVLAINERIGNQDIDGAIAAAEAAHEKFPENVDVLKGLAAMLYQTLPRESDEAVANKRRLQLGAIARDLVGGEQVDESVRRMSWILLLEEAKAHLAGQDLAAAFSSVRDARQNGFDQTAVLFFDPTFADMLADEAAMTEIKTWLGEEIKAKIAATESFPFDFRLPAFDGSEMALEDFKGKVLIVDFWGTWCPPCRMEIPHFVELVEKRGNDLAIVGINIEDPSGAPVTFEDAKAAFEEFSKTQPINYPCLAGNLETMEQVPNFEGYPTTLFLDSSGRVRLRLTGYQPLELLEVALDQLVANPGPAS